MMRNMRALEGVLVLRVVVGHVFLMERKIRHLLVLRVHHVVVHTHWHMLSIMWIVHLCHLIKM